MKYLIVLLLVGCTTGNQPIFEYDPFESFYNDSSSKYVANWHSNGKLIYVPGNYVPYVGDVPDYIDRGLMCGGLG